MIPESFDYVKATSVAHALNLLAEYGEDAKFLAGGHSLIPVMKFRLAAPSALVDISGLPELRTLTLDGEHLRLGAGLRYRDLQHSPLVLEHLPLLAQAAASVGDAQVRARGTIGGAVVHGDPAADLPAVLVAVDATMVLRGPGGDRQVLATDFFIDFWETAAAADEILLEVQVPALSGRAYSYQKFHQRSQDWAIVGVAAQELEGGGYGVGLVNMGPVPIRARTVEQALAAGADGPTAAARAAEGTRPLSDLRGDAAYRSHLAVVLTRRALQEVGAAR